MKKNVVVIFGGDSSEHDVSCLSATTVIKNMDTEKYNVILVGITKEGKWLLVDSVKDIEDGSWREGEVKAFISPDTTTRSLVILAEGTYKLQKVDVIFPVLHGMNGEDGTVQGLFELSKIPYVGCGVLASAVSMDKVYTKIIVDHIGIDQAKFVHVRESDFEHLDRRSNGSCGKRNSISNLCKTFLCRIFQGSFQSREQRRIKSSIIRGCET